MAKSTPPPLPPDPYAEVVARFGVENLEAILATYRQFADRVNYRAMMTWTIKQPLEDLLQPLFLAALVAITKGLDLGSVAAELQAAQSAEAEQDALAESLAATVRDLDAHIERRAAEIAQPQIDAVRADAERQIKELRHDLAFSEQRREDVIAEVQRQHKARDRHDEQQATRIADLAATVERVREIRCWQNEDGRWFAFREDLYAALNGEAPATETKANQEAGS